MIIRRLAVSTLFLAAACGGEPEEEVKTCEAASGVACVWAGNGLLGFNGDGLDLRESRMYWPIDVEFAPNGTPWVLDFNNHMIRKVLPNNTFETVVGNFVGDGPADQSDLMAPGAPGLTVALNHPTDIQFIDENTFYFAAWHNHKIRKLDINTGMVTVFTGRGVGYAGDAAMLSPASRYNQPSHIVLHEGSLYILDQRNFRIRKIDPQGMLSTVVGTGVAGFSGDDGSPTEAQIKFEAGGNPEPSGAMTIGSDGILYFSDGLNHRIRRVDFAANKITTIAGTGEAGYSGDGGPAVDAQINNVRDMELGPDGRLYLADSENHRIRAIDLSSGTIETVVGTGVRGTDGDGKPAKEVQLYRPFGIAFDKDGTLYVSDTFNSRVLRIPR